MTRNIRSRRDQRHLTRSRGLFCFRLSLLEFPGGEECPVVAPIVGGPSAESLLQLVRDAMGQFLRGRQYLERLFILRFDRIDRDYPPLGWVTIARLATFSMRLRSEGVVGGQSGSADY